MVCECFRPNLPHDRSHDPVDGIAGHPTSEGEPHGVDVDAAKREPVGKRCRELNELDG